MAVDVDGCVAFAVDSGGERWDGWRGFCLHFPENLCFFMAVMPQ
jgi:hypothetical protein